MNERKENISAVCDSVRATIDALNPRSAWDRGVVLYAHDLLDQLEDSANYNGALPAPGKETRDAMLNGAQDWNAYSWGGCSLIYNADIAKRLCCPSELKKTRNGDRRPNAREEWLDTQARALNQACRLVSGHYRRVMEGGASHD